MVPTYTFNDFVSACKNKVGSVYVIKGAQETARKDFGLKTNAAIVNFIGNDGVENPRFINTAHWKNNPNKTSVIMVDEYEFSTGSVLGYIAFLFQPQTDNWLVKSFKINKQPDTRNFPFEGLRKLIDDEKEPEDE